MPIEKSAPAATADRRFRRPAATPDVAKQPANLVTKARAAPEANPRDERMAATQKIARKEKGFPWLWIAVAAAAAFAGYRLWHRSKKK